jgi:hypothetical protein
VEIAEAVVHNATRDLIPSAYHSALCQPWAMKTGVEWWYTAVDEKLEIKLYLHSCVAESCHLSLKYWRENTTLVCAAWRNAT